jgi:hypothetical protein
MGSRIPPELPKSIGPVPIMAVEVDGASLPPPAHSGKTINSANKTHPSFFQLLIKYPQKNY